MSVNTIPAGGHACSYEHVRTAGTGDAGRWFSPCMHDHGLRAQLRGLRSVAVCRMGGQGTVAKMMSSAVLLLVALAALLAPSAAHARGILLSAGAAGDGHGLVEATPGIASRKLQSIRRLTKWMKPFSYFFSSERHCTRCPQSGNTSGNDAG